MTERDKRLFIKTYGCQMNVYDSQRMADALAPLGYRETEAPDDADLVILNTCHIREKAAEKVYSEIGRLRQLKAERADAGDMVIAVAGCVAQAEGEEIVRRAPAVDLVFGPQSYHRLPRLLARVSAGERGVVETEFPAEDKFAVLDHLNRRPGDAERETAAHHGPRMVTAFVTVQEGCDKFCTFCVVPYTRGAEFSRPVARIAGEVERLVASGVREVTLLGQNVNAYHGEGPDGTAWSLGRLITHLAGIEGLARLRYTTSHPLDMDDDLIAAHRDIGELMPFLHLPVQSGSDRILAAMNRRHSAADYLRVVERVRRARPDIALSSDFIVGFPGETDADFAATMGLVREVGFAQAFSFKYSARPGTPASEMDSQVPEPVKAERLAELQALLGSQARAFNDRCVGRTMPVLLEKPGRQSGQLTGRSPYLQPVYVTAAADRIGDLVEVTIDAAGPNSLGGKIVSNDAHRSYHDPVTQSEGIAL